MRAKSMRTWIRNTEKKGNIILNNEKKINPRHVWTRSIVWFCTTIQKSFDFPVIEPSTKKFGYLFIKKK